MTFPLLASARRTMALMRQHQYTLVQCLKSTEVESERHKRLLVMLAKARQLDRRAQASLRHLESLLFQHQQTKTEQGIDRYAEIIMLNERSAQLRECGLDIA